MHKKESIIYPWLSIWIHPRKTLRYMLRFPNIFTILLLFILILFINLDNSAYLVALNNDGASKLIIESFHIFLEVLGLYLSTWIINKKKNLKKSIIVLFLYYFPFLIYNLAVLLGLDLEGNVLKYTLLIGLLWYFILYLTLIKEGFHLSKIKTFLVFLLSMIFSESIYIGILYLVAIYANPFIG